MLFKISLLQKIMMKLLFFTNLGRVYSMKVLKFLKHLVWQKAVQLLIYCRLQPDEQVVKLLCTRDMEDKFIVMVTKNGIIKRTDAIGVCKNQINRYSCNDA